jgi:hypothetical protein
MGKGKIGIWGRANDDEPQASVWGSHSSDGLWHPGLPAQWRHSPARWECTVVKQRAVGSREWQEARVRVISQETGRRECEHVQAVQRRDAHSVNGTGRPRSVSAQQPAEAGAMRALCFLLKHVQAAGTTTKDEVGRGDDTRVSLNCQPIPVSAVDRQQYSAYQTDGRTVCATLALARLNQVTRREWPCKPGRWISGALGSDSGRRPFSQRTGAAIVNSAEVVQFRAQNVHWNPGSGLSCPTQAW